VLRLPPFEYHRPSSAAEAVAIAQRHAGKSMFVAGGTDLWPNMKRRHQSPEHVVSLQDIPELNGVVQRKDGGFDLGAMVKLSELERHAALREKYAALVHAVAEISTPLLRNMGTIGGNVLLDTRCTYYDQTFEWREAISFCMKKDGAICWVAPGSPRCWAVQSSDTAPVLCALGAEVTLVGPAGTRKLKADDLYRDDGIQYLNKLPEELLTAIHLPAPGSWKASYLKLRRRGTFDFPVLGTAACLWFERDGKTVEQAAIRLGGAGSYPIRASEAEQVLTGRPLTEELIVEAANTAYKPARTMDNTDHDVAWRKRMAPVFVARALRECR
jgi:4-hydroxybenzoyl-CoA reductase subunit beta